MGSYRALKYSSGEVIARARFLRLCHHLCMILFIIHIGHRALRLDDQMLLGRVLEANKCMASSWRERSSAMHQTFQDMKASQLVMG